MDSFRRTKCHLIGQSQRLRRRQRWQYVLPLQKNKHQSSSGLSIYRQWNIMAEYLRDDDRANLNAVYFGDTLRLFALSPAGNEQNLFTSLDTGHTWTLMSKLPTNPWNVGLYVSPSDPSKMMYGEVDSYRTENGGDFWIKNSNWWEYYDDIFTKLHADIMDIKEFETEAGEPFYIVCNHGGVSQSFDYGQSFENIALASLNIGQYYSVVTHPTEREFVYAGAQDQGLQRGRITGDGIASLDQVISGDYGHMVFSGPEDHFWAMYPGGAISYYQKVE